MPEHRQRHDPSKTLVGFTVGEVRYAIAIGEVREICNPLPLVALPHAPPAVQGVTDYRGEVIPVIDLRQRFGLPAAEASRRIKWIVVQVGAGLMAVVVDEMLGVFGTGGTGIRPAPPLGGGEHVRGIEGVTTHPLGLVFVVDVGSLRELAPALALPEHVRGAPPQDESASAGRLAKADGS